VDGDAGDGSPELWRRTAENAPQKAKYCWKEGQQAEKSTRMWKQSLKTGDKQKGPPGTARVFVIPLSRRT